jgi:arylsulfatase A-like enzyme
VATSVSAGSLLPTLLDLAGLDVPPEAQYPSLAPILRGEGGVDPAPVFSEIDYGLWGYRDGDRHVMVREGSWKLCLYRDPADHTTDPADHNRFEDDDDRVLFNLAEDPGERRNRAHDPAYAGVIDDLIAHIDAWDRSRPLA